MAIINIQFEIPDGAMLALLSKARPVQPLAKNSKLHKSIMRQQAEKKAALKAASKKAAEAKKDPSAPWGFKKDGTPKKRPGRPVK